MARQSSFIKLCASEVGHLQTLLQTGTHPARVQNRGRTLLLNHEGRCLQEIAPIVGLCYGCVAGIVRDYRAGGLDYALNDLPRSGAPPKITERVEAYTTSIACSEVPEGHVSWTLEMIRDELVRLEIVDSLSKTSTHTILKKVNLNLGNKIFGASKK